MSETGERIDRVFREHFGKTALEEFTNDEVFVELPTPGQPPKLRLPGDITPLDSLDRLEFIMSLEEEFDICIDEGDVPTLQKRSEVIAFIDERIGKP